MEPIKPLAIGDLLELLAAQPDPDRAYALGFDYLRLLIDEADKDAATMLVLYMETFPGKSIEDAVKAFQSASFWLSFMMRVIKPPEKNETKPEG